MKKPHVLISGRTIVNDKQLYNALQNIAVILSNADNQLIESIIAQKHIDLAIIEVLKNHPDEVDIIKKIKTRFPNIIIIFLNGNQDRDLIVNAFSYGAKDAFRKPYRIDLIVERVRALLKNTR